MSDAGDRCSDLSACLERAIAELGCAGALCAVERGGGVTTFSAGTVTAVEHDRPFYVYSITKSFTAAAVLRLGELEGCLLDRAVVSLLPAAKIPRDVTVRQLLNHTAGLSDYFSRQDYRDAVNAQPESPWPRERLMSIGLEKTPLFAPGAGWAYSNPGYGLLLDLIEKVSGEHFDACIDRLILKPAGLTATRGFLAPDTEGLLLPGEAPGMDGDFRARYHPGWIATGCLISTVRDVVRFYAVLFAGEIVSAASLRAMTRVVDVPFPMPAPVVAAYGLGLMHFRHDPIGASFGHGGGGPGYTTLARHYPQLNGGPLTLSLVLNKSLPQTPFALADALVRAVLAGEG